MGNINKGMKLVALHQEIDAIISKCQIILAKHPEVQQLCQDIEGELCVLMRKDILTMDYKDIIPDLRTFAESEWNKYLTPIVSTTAT